MHFNEKHRGPQRANAIAREMNAPDAKNKRWNINDRSRGHQQHQNETESRKKKTPIKLHIPNKFIKLNKYY